MSRLRVVYILFIVVYFCSLVTSCLGTRKILGVFPTPSISHQVVFRALTHAQAGHGHKVVVITPDPVFPKTQAPENLTEIDVHKKSYEVWRTRTIAHLSTTLGDNKYVSGQSQVFNSICLEAFEKQTASPEVRDIIDNKNDTFDLLLVEAWTRYALGFSQVIKAPVIAVSSCGAVFDQFKVMGGPTHPLLYPQALQTRLFDLTIWEKITQLYDIFSTLNQNKLSEIGENYVARRIFGENTPALSELQNNIQMLFLNIDQLWDANRPVPPGVIYIGGIHQQPQKELPKDLKHYLDSSEHGVIYLSFGTNVETSILPADKVQAIINAFSQLPYDVIWKWNQVELPGRTKNIRISKWLPQSDLLKHPKVKLFITQGGLQSADETIAAGVPVVVIPLLTDQWYNAEQYVHHKVGKKIELGDLDEETLKSVITTVIEDTSYRDNMLRLRTLMTDRPMSSLARALWWSDRVLRHGGRHLRAPAANMADAEYYELRLVLVLLIVAAAGMVLGALILCKFGKFMLKLLWYMNRRLNKIMLDKQH